MQPIALFVLRSLMLFSDCPYLVAIALLQNIYVGSPFCLISSAIRPLHWAIGHLCWLVIHYFIEQSPDRLHESLCNRMRNGWYGTD